MRTCSTCHGEFQPKTSRQRHCSTPCRDRMLGRKRRIKRGTTTDRGYGSQHRKVRAEMAKVVDAGNGYCWRPRCRKWLDPTQPWHAGHDDHDRSIYRGPECVRCNTSNAAKIGNAQRVTGQVFSSRPRIV